MNQEKVDFRRSATCGWMKMMACALFNEIQKVRLGMPVIIYRMVLFPDANTAGSAQFPPPSRYIRQLTMLIRHRSPAARTRRVCWNRRTRASVLPTVRWHRSNQRYSKPFIAINCSALPEHSWSRSCCNHARGALYWRCNACGRRYAIAEIKIFRHRCRLLRVLR